MMEQSPQNDAKFEGFTRHVAEVLETFVKCRDWPDFIHSIEAMKAAFQKYPDCRAVPHKTTIAKRLAQGCTSSTDAVHRKSLELYELIFNRIGEVQLAKDLGLYTLGIFPLFAHGAQETRLKILELIGTHFLPLGAQLLPCLTGMLPALLSAFDEKEQQTYSAVLALLETVETRICASQYYLALWQSILLNPQDSPSGQARRGR